MSVLWLLLGIGAVLAGCWSILSPDSLWGRRAPLEPMARTLYRLGGVAAIVGGVMMISRGYALIQGN